MKSIARRLKTLAKAVLGKELLINPDVTIDKERFGSDYGGWDIVVTGLNADSVVYSFGVGEDASFDVALIDKFALTIHAFDPTPKSIEWVKRQRFSDKFVMHSYGIAAFDGDVSFNPPENPDHVSHTILDRPSTKTKAIWVPVKKMSTIMQELGHDHIHIVKMDIEGAEYDVIEDIYQSNVRPDQMLIEFHHRFPGVGTLKTRDAINKVRAMGYQLFSVSDTKEEFGFIRRQS
ncbi:MAG: FkbM family methyltransferase [Anaerolineales bacterium]|nr:FkbM family methyltransferase [Anaerolineales bacterium]